MSENRGFKAGETIREGDFIRIDSKGRVFRLKTPNTVVLTNHEDPSKRITLTFLGVRTVGVYVPEKEPPGLLTRLFTWIKEKWQKK